MNENAVTIDTTTITRVEVIDSNGRSYINRDDNNKVQIFIQDDGRTMKVVIMQGDQ